MHSQQLQVDKEAKVVLWSPGTPGVLQYSIVDVELSEVLPDFQLRLTTEQCVHLHCALPDNDNNKYYYNYDNNKYNN